MLRIADGVVLIRVGQQRLLARDWIVARALLFARMRLVGIRNHGLASVDYSDIHYGCRYRDYRSRYLDHSLVEGHQNAAERQDKLPEFFNARTSVLSLRGFTPSIHANSLLATSSLLIGVICPREMSPISLK